MVEKMGERLHSLSPCRHVPWGKSVGEPYSVSTHLPPSALGVGMDVGDDGECGVEGVVGGQGHVEQPSASGDGYGSGPACGMGYGGGLGPIGGKRAGDTPSVLGDGVGVTEEEG